MLAKSSILTDINPEPSLSRRERVEKPARPECGWVGRRNSYRRSLRQITSKRALPSVPLSLDFPCSARDSALISSALFCGARLKLQFFSMRTVPG